MKKIKILAVIVLFLFVLFAVALIIVGSHLGDIVKAGMEQFGPKVTQTTLTVSAVDISLLGGSAGVKGLVLGNPDGYQAPQSISFSNATVSLVPGSVLSDKIIIHSIEVRAPEITFEGNPLGANNLTKILANVKAATGSAAPGVPADTNTASAPPAAETKPGKKLEVDDFLIAGAIVHANLTSPLNREFTFTLPDIHLTGLGQGTDGITVADLTQKILGQITADTIQAVVSSASQLGKNSVDAAKSAAQDAVNGAAQKTGLGGSNTVDSLKKGLGGLFGK